MWWCSSVTWDGDGGRTEILEMVWALCVLLSIKTLAQKKKEDCDH